MQGVERELKEVFYELFGLGESKVGTETSIDTVEGWDSMAHLNLVIAIEERFSISLTPEEVSKMTSYESIKDIITKKTIIRSSSSSPLRY